jgi:hypothetical protein
VYGGKEIRKWGRGGYTKCMKIYKRLHFGLSTVAAAATVVVVNNSKPLLIVISNYSLKDYHSFVSTRTNCSRYDLTSEHNEGCVQCASGCVALPREQPHRSK